MDAEFLIDEEPSRVESSLREGLIAVLRQLRQLRQNLQEQNLTRDEEIRMEAEFLKQLLATKERRCDQFVAAARSRQSEDDGADACAREETEKWVHRLEAFQQSFDAALLKHGVTRYEPSGKALPDRDDIKDTLAGTGLEPGTIVKILKPSYLWRGEILRPAEVVIAD